MFGINGTEYQRKSIVNEAPLSCCCEQNLASDKLVPPTAIYRPSLRVALAFQRFGKPCALRIARSRRAYNRDGWPGWIGAY
jgi:hypothetical protein